MVRNVGCSLSQALSTASLSPALVVGIADRKVILEPGKDADLVVVDEDVNVYLTMVNGRVVYVAQNGLILRQSPSWCISSCTIS